MTAETAPAIGWAGWLRRWDVQQQGYLPDREERFSMLLDVLDAQLDPGFVALDLACGPGAISERLLRRFPESRTIALDTDPVLLALGGRHPNLEPPLDTSVEIKKGRPMQGGPWGLPASASVPSHYLTSSPKS